MVGVALDAAEVLAAQGVNAEVGILSGFFRGDFWRRRYPSGNVNAAWRVTSGVSGKPDRARNVDGDPGIRDILRNA